MATRDAQRCLAAGSGRWEPIADWSGPPYTLRPNTYESRLSAYAPHLCDRWKTSSRLAVKWRWVPEGPGCSALRLPADTHVLTTAFCRRFAGSSILVVGESVQACRHPPSPGRSWTHASSLHVPAQVPLYVALASHLGVQQWHWHLCQEGVRKSALGMEVLASATVCSATPEAAVTVQYVANEYSIINASLTGGAGQIACDAQCDGLRCKRQLPFLAYARRSRFVILTTPPPAEARGYGGSVAEEVRNTLETLATLRPRPRVLVRSPIQSFPPGLCKRMVDPLAKPFEYNLTEPSHQRAILRFKMHLGKQSNEEARAAVDAYAAAHGKHVAYMDMFRATSLRPGGRHSARKDCTHWCLPGPIDDWVRLALAWWLLREGS